MTAAVEGLKLRSLDGKTLTLKLTDNADGTYSLNSVSTPAAVGVGAVTSASRVVTVGSDSTSRIVSAAASTNATSAKASAGKVSRVIGYNAASALRYLKFYNKASAPTVGTDTPVLTIALPPLTAFDLNIEHYFSTGIAYALTTAAADNDTGALTAGDVTALNVLYA